MKLSKRKVFLAALAICIVAILSFSTLAWFNASDSVTNNFYVATSDDTDPDDIFSVDVWEYVDGDTTNKDQDGADFKDIVPGERIHKEPYVENTGYYSQWIRVKVKVTDATEWKTALAKYNITDLSTIFEGHDASAWTRYDEPTYDAESDTLEYVYYLNYRLTSGSTACVFNTVVIPEELTQEDMVFLNNDFKIIISAEAIQSDNTGATAKEAFDKNW